MKELKEFKEVREATIRLLDKISFDTGDLIYSHGVEYIRISISDNFKYELLSIDNIEVCKKHFSIVDCASNLCSIIIELLQSNIGYYNNSIEDILNGYKISDKPECKFYLIPMRGLLYQLKKAFNEESKQMIEYIIANDKVFSKKNEQKKE